MILIQKDGKTIASSQNLAGIMRYARAFPATLKRKGHWLVAHFDDGATCVTTFASETVLQRWIENRVRYGRGKFRNSSS